MHQASPVMHMVNASDATRSMLAPMSRAARASATREARSRWTGTTLNETIAPGSIGEAISTVGSSGLGSLLCQGIAETEATSATVARSPGSPRTRTRPSSSKPTHSSPASPMAARISAQAATSRVTSSNCGWAHADEAAAKRANRQFVRGIAWPRERSVSNVSILSGRPG